MKTFVNALSIFRIVAAFALIPLMMYRMVWLAFIIYVLAALSDFFDGWLARKYNVETKIGGVMDHIGDKLLVINTMVLLAVMMPIWFITVPIVLMIAREIYISGLREFLGTQKITMPVPSPRFSMGKIKTTLQMVSIGAFLFIFAIGTALTPEMSNRFLMYLVYIAPFIAIFGLWLALTASIISAAEYTRDFIRKLK